MTTVKQSMAPDDILAFADALQHRAAATPAAEVERELQLVAFALDREEFAIPIAQIREIIRVGDITRIPQAPPHVRGVMNLRGRILPVVELRSRLGLPPAEVTSRSRVLVADAQGRTLGLLVDAVTEVVKIPERAIVPPPDDILAANANYITGVARLGSRLLILLELDQAVGPGSSSPVSRVPS
jgi:purine-binding chemotaxis protein CheW